MKQLLFLLLFPCFALAQYQGNANQKITLGEQTTADGLVWRGRLADTANLLTNKLDTSVYIVLDTGTRAMWYYRASTTPKWTRLVDSLNNLQGQLSLTTKVTGVLPVANGGTGQSTLAAAGINTGSGTLNYLPKYTATGTTLGNSIIFDNGSNVGIGTTSLTAKLDVNGDIKFKNSLQGEITSSGAQIVFYNNANQPFWINMQNNNNTGRFICGVEGTAGATFTGSSANSSFFGSNAGDLHILSNGSIRQTITSTGNIGIGTVSPQSGYKLHVVDSVYVGGNVSASAYTTRSDYDLKDEIQNINYGINEVMQMQPVKYTYKSNGSTQLGFIAQDLGVITPEVVSFEDKMSVYYNALIPILTKAIQEQQALIKALEQRIINLENK